MHLIGAGKFKLAKSYFRLQVRSCAFMWFSPENVLSLNSEVSKVMAEGYNPLTLLATPLSRLPNLLYY